MRFSGDLAGLGERLDSMKVYFNQTILWFSGTTGLLSASLFLQDTCMGVKQKLSCKQLPYFVFILPVLLDYWKINLQVTRKEKMQA